MRSQRFAHEVLFAAAVTTACYLFSLLSFALPFGASWLLAAATAVALLRTLSISTKTGGRFLSAVFSIAAVITIGFAPFCYWSAFMAATATLWLMRCFRRYHSLLLPLLDGALSIAAFVISLACFQRTSSLAISLGAFFLLQGLHVYLPSTLRVTSAKLPLSNATKGFDEAYRRAEAILQGRS